MTSYFSPSEATARRAAGLAALVSTGLLLTGCQKEEITVYRVPKVPPGAGAATDPHAAPASPHASPRPHAHWGELPAGWSEAPAAGSRAATFTIAGKDGQRAEAAVIAFPGMGGTDLEFVNLWRQQLGLPPLTSEELPKLVQSVNIAGADGKLFDLTGTPKATEQAADRIMVALQKQDGVSWFIKLTGSAALVEQQKPAFLSFLKSLKFHAGSDEAEPSAPAPATASAAPSQGAGAPAWTAPSHWKQQAPGAMQAAKYTVGEGKAKAEVTAVFLGGMGGALKANLDRWRAQLTLPASAESEVEKLAPPFPALGAGARIVELSGSTGEGDPADMIVLLVPSGRGTWFYKLMGDKAVVAKEKDALITFVKSAKN